MAERTLSDALPPSYALACESVITPDLAAAVARLFSAPEPCMLLLDSELHDLDRLDTVLSTCLMVTGCPERTNLMALLAWVNYWHEDINGAMHNALATFSTHEISRDLIAQIGSRMSGTRALEIARRGRLTYGT